MKTEKKLRIYVTRSKTSHKFTHQNIWIDFGKHRFILSDLNKVNHKIEKEFKFTVDIPDDFSEKSISRVLIYKNADKNHEKWYLKGIRVELNKKVIYDNQRIRFKFEDGVKNEWLASDFKPISKTIKNSFLSEESMAESVDHMLNSIFKSGTWNNLKLQGSSTIDIACASITVTQEFVADIPGPNPTLTLWLKLIPYIFEGKVEARIRSYELFADYPWWFEVVTLGISNLMEIQIEGDLQKKIKENIQELIQQNLLEMNPQNKESHVSLRMHKIEIISWE